MRIAQLLLQTDSGVVGFILRITLAAGVAAMASGEP